VLGVGARQDRGIDDERVTRDTSRVGEVTIRDLRHHGGEIVDRAAAGEHVTITRGGRAVAELRPVVEPWLGGEALLERWRQVPVVDPGAWRRDVDAVLDPRW